MLQRNYWHHFQSKLPVCEFETGECAWGDCYHQSKPECKAHLSLQDRQHRCHKETVWTLIWRSGNVREWVIHRQSETQRKSQVHLKLHGIKIQLFEQLQSISLFESWTNWKALNYKWYRIYSKQSWWILRVWHLCDLIRLSWSLAVSYTCLGSTVDKNLVKQVND